MFVTDLKVLPYVLPRMAALFCLAGSGLFVSAGCSSAPKENPMLEEARVAYENTAEDVIIARHAADELDKAREALSTADKRWKDKEPREEVEHYAYLARQRVEIARLIARSNENDRELEAMELERRNVTLDLREAELSKARLKSKELERQMKMLQARKTERGMVLTLGDVLFEINETSLAPGAARNIGKIAAFMRNYPEVRAIIEGHTDSMGDEHYNLGLSQERAFAVREALVKAGVTSNRISTRGFGEAMPVASNAHASGRQKNRRVEIIFPDNQSTLSELNHD